MRSQTGKIVRTAAATMVLLAGSALLARNHHQLNGTWVLMPERSDFGEQAAIAAGMITINDREHNIYVDRNFTYGGPDESRSYSFSIDGRENSKIRDGKTFKTKAKWDGDVLRVTTVNGNTMTEERFHLNPDGTLTLAVERPDHRIVTLFFQRQYR